MVLLHSKIFWHVDFYIYRAAQFHLLFAFDKTFRIAKNDIENQK